MTDTTPEPPLTYVTDPGEVSVVFSEPDEDGKFRIFYDLDHMIAQFTDELMVKTLMAMATGDPADRARCEGVLWVVKSMQSSRESLLLHAATGL